MAASSGATGWPFLVAPGRVRDHTVVVAPAPLVASGEYGALEMVAGPGSPSVGWEQSSIRRPGGDPLAVTYRTRAVTSEDIAAQGVDPTTPSAVRDEHNRPLLAIVGIVSDGPLSGDVSADLALAWESVLPAYRTFLDDEPGFVVTGSTGIALASRRQSAPVCPPVLPEISYAAAGPTGASERGAGGPGSRSMVLLLGLVAAAVVALALVLHPWSSSPRVPAPTPSVTVDTTTAPGATPSRSPTSSSRAEPAGSVASGRPGSWLA